MANRLSSPFPEFFTTLGAIAANGALAFYASGTSTPLATYSDVALTIANSNPLTLNAAGFPSVGIFLTNSVYKVVLTDGDGNTVWTADPVRQVDSVIWSGIAKPPMPGTGFTWLDQSVTPWNLNLFDGTADCLVGTIDPTTHTFTLNAVSSNAIFITGDIKTSYRNGTHTGWVRVNGRTIGSASSGATERANADCSALFQFLWNQDPNLAVSGGRGVSAAADWAANKTIALPDARGIAFFGNDAMGNSAANRVTNALSGIVGTTLGAAGGEQAHTLITAELAAHSHGVTDPGHTHAYDRVQGATPVIAAGADYGLNPATSGTHTTGITIQNAGSGTAHQNMSPAMIATYYIKL